MASITAPRRRVAPATRAVDWIDAHLKWILIAPSVVFIALLIAFPIGYTIFLSLTDSSGAVSRPFEFVGLDNYIGWLTDTERFWPAVGRTAYFTGMALALEIVLGLAIALLLRKTFRGQSIVRVFILLPLVATPVAVGMMWLLIFEPTIGFANVVMRFFGLPAQGWLSDPSMALNTLIFIDVWQWTPMVILILLAGLSTLPEEPDEAARVDGANAWQRFRHITLPLLAPVIGAAAILRSIDAMKTFDIIYATKGIGGGSSHEAETLNILAYGQAFQFSQYGKASALLMLFFLLIVVVLLVLAILRNRGARS
ncbi:MULTISPECIES: sugar ABC transporter permease [unclassified Microbacterium]|uniref:carbohydrate ABC transporter permease n=1 Tax=unclassified Microbacterium TaxID=2609290 RepID=UPI001D499DEC|nr:MULTISPECIES: sugar ABC transporter permease [unclassified Microbacterium]CAH0146722.1 Trehalose transport system permease protein SugA [Microbacterium sp. Bi128]